MFKRLSVLAKCAFTSKQKKITFLQNKVYSYYYTVLLNKEMKSDVSVPYFLVINEIKSNAMRMTTRDLDAAIKDCRINECYKRALMSVK